MSKSNPSNFKQSSSVSYLGWIRYLLDKWQPSPEIIFMGTALLVGVSTGLGAVFFRYLIRGVEWVGYGWLPSFTTQWGSYYVVFVPTFGGLLVGLLVYYFAREAKGHGVPEVMEAVALRGGRIRPVVAVVKSLASSICIGSGGSVGREGPIVQIGSAMGSTIGQAFHLSDGRIRNLVACGAAAGIATTFNAPIAGVIFALEIIVDRFSTRYFSSVVISAVAASVIGRAVFGNTPAFSIPIEYGVNSLWEFLFYLILGVLAAVLGVVYIRLLYWSEDRFDAWKHIPEWVKPAIGGLGLGGLALTYPLLTGVTWDRVPQVYNVGYDVIEATLANQLALRTVLVLLVLKLVATSLTLGSGGSGGVFAPGLFMGAMLGSGLELVVNQWFPGVAAPPGAYALVGMAAVFAASAHAPITAVLILFELTGDYRIILPLMWTVVIATILAQRFLSGESIYTLKLTRRGIRIHGGRDLDLMQSLLVREAMDKNPYVVPRDMSVDRLGRFLYKTHSHSFPVVDELSQLVGMVSLRDYEKVLDHPQIKQLTVADIATMDKVLVAYEDEPVSEAIKRLAVRSIHKLPIVSRENPKMVIGVIRRDDIVKAYNMALVRRTNEHFDVEKARLRRLDTTEFLEVEIDSDSPVVYQNIASIGPQLPQDCIIVFIRRHGSLLIPHGDTVLYPGDLVNVFLHQKDEAQLRACLLHRDGI